MHPDVVNAIKYLAEITEGNPMLIQAYDLCVSKYVLSRMFAKTFHCNFSKYVNGVRLNYADGKNKEVKPEIVGTVES